MAKFKVGDKVTANYGTYVENGVVFSAVEVNSFTTDYTVRFSDGSTDIFDESELEANPNN
jgi:hypothetical protein